MAIDPNDPKLSVRVESVDALQRVDNMIVQLAELPAVVATEFMKWQVEDMNRNKPHVVALGTHVFMTHFWNNPRWRKRKAPAAPAG